MAFSIPYFRLCGPLSQADSFYGQRLGALPIWSSSKWDKEKNKDYLNKY